MLNNKQKKELRKLAHQEKPSVQIGKNGITDTVLESFENALIANNLVKVDLLKTAPITAKEAAEVFSENFACDVVHIIGRVVILYRYHKEGRVQI